MANVNNSLQELLISVPDAAPDSVVPFLRFKYEVEQYLRDSGLTFVILRAAAFMESHAHMLIGESILTKGKVLLFGEKISSSNFVHLTPKTPVAFAPCPVGSL